MYGELERIDHEEALLEALPYYWQRAQNLEGLARATGASYQGIEDDLLYLLEQDSLYNAVGPQLDRDGLILDEPRDDRGDNEYRTALLSKTYTRGTSGTTRDIKRVSKAVTGATVCKVFSHYPLCTYVFVNALAGVDETRAIQDTHMSSVNTRVIWSDEDYYVRTAPTPEEGIIYEESGGFVVECGSSLAECGSDESEAGGYINSSPASGYPYGWGFTSLSDGAVGYSVVDDSKGYMCTIAPDTKAEVDTGLIIDYENNYIITQEGTYIRYID